MTLTLEYVFQIANFTDVFTTRIVSASQFPIPHDDDALSLSLSLSPHILCGAALRQSEGETFKIGNLYYDIFAH